jgi:hypothetical protein
VEDVLNFRQLVLAATGRASHPASDFAGRENNNGNKEQQNPRKLAA